MVNAAYTVGLGSCWVHRCKEVFETPEGKALLCEWGMDSRSNESIKVGNITMLLSGYRVGESSAIASTGPRNSKDRVDRSAFV